MGARVEYLFGAWKYKKGDCSSSSRFFFFRCTGIVGALVATVVLHCVGLRHARLCGGSLSSDFTLCEKLSLGKYLDLKRDGGPHL